MIGFLLLFIGYQLYRLVLSPTFGLSALTIFDAVIVWLTWREWRKQTTDRGVGLSQRPQVAALAEARTGVPGMLQRSACRPGPSANLYGIRARSSSASRTMLAGLEFRPPLEGGAWPWTGPTGARE